MTDEAALCGVMKDLETGNHPGLPRWASGSLFRRTCQLPEAAKAGYELAADPQFPGLVP